MQWPGGVGRDELHQHARTPADITLAVVLAGCEDARKLTLPGRGREKDVDEPGTGDFRLLDGITRRQRGLDGRGQLARVAPRAFGEHEGRVGGKVAVARAAAVLHHDGATGLARDAQVVECGVDGLLDAGFHVGCFFRLRSTISYTSAESVGSAARRPSSPRMSSCRAAS